MLRTAAFALRAGLSASAARVGAPGAAAAQAQAQQRRGAHELHAHTNKWVEKWLSRREDIEQEFVWDRATTRAVIIGAVVVPVLMYNAVVYCAHQDDDFGDRPRRNFLWAHAEKGPGA